MGIGMDGGYSEKNGQGCGARTYQWHLLLLSVALV